ncbi:hypothetical protein Hdeb2414_s0006g00205431 [Helianthus debilis subsp. tardiflorus]
MRITQHCGWYFLFIGDFPQPAPFEHLGIKTMTGMHIAVNFPGIGYRFVGLNGQIFVPKPIVHQALLKAGEVEMPDVVDVHVRDGDLEPEVDQGHLQEPPQIPRPVYHVVRLPQSTQHPLERLVEGQADMMASWTQQFQWMDRMEI